MIYEVVIGETIFKVELRRATERSPWECSLNGKRIELDAQLSERDVLSVVIGGASVNRAYEIKNDVVAGQVAVGARRYPVEVRDPRSLRSRKGTAAGTDGVKKIIAPMPGKVVRVLAVAGTQVEAGQGVIVIEAMKMQNELKSPKKGVVKKIMAMEGETVNAGDALALVE